MACKILITWCDATSVTLCFKSLLFVRVRLKLWKGNHKYFQGLRFEVWTHNIYNYSIIWNEKNDSINSRKRKQLNYNQSCSIGLIRSHNLLSLLFPFTLIPISNTKIQVRIALVATKVVIIIFNEPYAIVEWKKILYEIMSNGMGFQSLLSWKNNVFG